MTFMAEYVQRPHMALRSMIRSWGQVLVFADRFFAERTPPTGDGGIPVGIVAGLHVIGYYVVLGAGAFIVAMKHGQYTVVETITDLSWQTLAPGLLLGGLVIVNWLVVSGVLHTAIKLRHGNGTFSDTLFLVGWSSPVALVVLLFWGGGFLLSVAESPLVMSYDARVVATAPAAKIAAIVGGFITLLWQGLIWTDGLQHRHGVGRTKAVHATVVTVALGIVALVAAA